MIYDDIFTLDISRVEEFCSEFRKRGLYWRCWSRADCVDREKLIIMKSSGLVSITFGIESGSDVILKNINKMASSYDNFAALRLCNELNIPVRCSLMYGNPGEDMWTLSRTINMVAKCKPSEWNLSILTPIPGSEFWENPNRHGIQFDKDEIEANDYFQLNRFGDSGVGNTLIKIDSMSNDDFNDNLKWFVGKLESMCPRIEIQDTIQSIDVDKIGA